MKAITAPPSLRLVPCAGARSPRPPLGLARFEEASVDFAVATARDDDLTSLVGRIPPAAAQPPGARAFVLSGADRGALARVFGRATPLSRAVRATALLVAGYRNVAATVDAQGEDVVVGEA